MCKISCPVCNPIARRRRRRHLADTQANAQVEFFRRLAEVWTASRKATKTEKRARLARAYGASDETLAKMRQQWPRDRR